MTTTQLIMLLQKYEHGGATGKSREITIWKTNKKGCLSKLVLGSKESLVFSSCGDGLVTDLCLIVKPTEAQL